MTDKARLIRMLRNGTPKDACGVNTLGVSRCCVLAELIFSCTSGATAGWEQDIQKSTKSPLNWSTGSVGVSPAAEREARKDFDFAVLRACDAVAGGTPRSQ